MGQILKINPANIQPPQDFLKANTLVFIEENYKNGFFDKLPPVPIVRGNSQGGYIAIDGHNLLAFYTSLDIECDVYVAENKNDGLVGDLEMIKKRNQDLFDKYDLVITKVKELRENGIGLIKDLLNRVKRNSC